MTNRSRPHLSRLISGLIVGGLLAIVGAAAPAHAADHLDAPGLTPPGGDGALDIADVYAFRNPANHNNAVLIMTVNPAAGVISGTTFRTETSYDFRLDFDGDAGVDRMYRIGFGPPDESGKQFLQLRCVPAARCPGKGAVVARGFTGQSVQGNDGSTIHVDTFDDPFFFDLDAFLGTNGRAFCDGNESDFFLGLDVSAIVLQIPRENLDGDVVGVWATTETAEDGQVDRMGRPAINTVFIPANPFEPNEASQKNFFNQSKPHFDRRDFLAEVKDTLALFYGAGNPAVNQLANVLLPDILTVDFSSGAGFLNGRRPEDDVIDAELAIVTNGAVTSDCVDNDSPFLTVFPFLAPPNGVSAAASASASTPAAPTGQPEPGISSGVEAPSATSIDTDSRAGRSRLSATRRR